MLIAVTYSERQEVAAGHPNNGSNLALVWVKSAHDLSKKNPLQFDPLLAPNQCNCGGIYGLLLRPRKHKQCIAVRASCISGIGIQLASY